MEQCHGLPASATPPLHMACASGKVRLVKKLLAALSNSGTVSDTILSQDQVNKSTSLHAAVHGGNPEILKELTSKLDGATVDPQDKNGDTPLHLAVSKATANSSDDQEAAPFLEMVNVLIARGADPNQKNLCHQTPVVLAQDHQTLFELLVKENLRRSDYTERLLVMLKQRNIAADKLSVFVLNFAVESRNVSLLQDILDVFPAEECKNLILTKYLDLNAYERAISGADLTVFRLLMEKMDGFEIDDAVEIPLHLQKIYSENSRMALLIITRRLTVEVLNEIGTGAQHTGTEWEAIEKLKTFLLHFLINLDDVNDGRQSLRRSTTMAETVADLFLFDNSLKRHIVQLHNLTGDTALHAAVKTENQELLKLFLKFLEQPDECNVLNIKGETPLQVCLKLAETATTKEIRVEMAKLLLDHGSDPQHVSLDDVVHIDDGLLHKVLEDLIAKLGTQSNLGAEDNGLAARRIRVAVLQVACKSNNEAMVQHLLHKLSMKGHVITVNTLTSRDPLNGDTAVHAAVRCGNVSVLRMILSANKEAANCVIHLGQTPLHLALEKGDVEMVKALEAAGAEHTADTTGADSFHFAARASSTSSLEHLSKARERFSIESLTKDGFTPLHFAAWNGNAGVVDWLLKHDDHLQSNLERRDEVKQALPWQWAAMGASDHDSPGALEAIVRCHAENNVRLFPGENRPKDWYVVFQRIQDQLLDRVSSWVIEFIEKPTYRYATSTSQDMEKLDSFAERVKRLEPGLLACSAAYGGISTNRRLANLLQKAARTDMEMVVELVNDSHMLEWAARRATDADVVKNVEPLIELVVEMSHERLEPQLLTLSFAYAFEEENKREVFLEALARYCRDKSGLLTIVTKSLIMEEAERVAKPMKVELRKRANWWINISKAGNDLLEHNMEKLKDDIPLAYWLALLVTYSCNPKFQHDKLGAQIYNEELVKRVDEFAHRFIPDYPNDKGVYSGRTALHWAAILNQVDIVGALKGNGRENWRNCRVDVFDMYDKSPYWYATYHNDEHILSLLKWEGHIKSMNNERTMIVTALNAILVAAALVATVSYTGVLNPPLGFNYKPSNNITDSSNNSTGSDVKYVVISDQAVAWYWYFNGFAFILALISALAAVTGLSPLYYSYQTLRKQVEIASNWLRSSALNILVAFVAANYADLAPSDISYAHLTAVIAGVYFLRFLLKLAELRYRLVTNLIYYPGQLFFKLVRPQEKKKSKLEPLAKLLVPVSVSGRRYTRTAAPWDIASQQPPLEHRTLNIG